MAYTFQSLVPLVWVLHSDQPKILNLGATTNQLIPHSPLYVLSKGSRRHTAYTFQSLVPLVWVLHYDQPKILNLGVTTNQLIPHLPLKVLSKGSRRHIVHTFWSPVSVVGVRSNFKLSHDHLHITRKLLICQRRLCVPSNSRNSITKLKFLMFYIYSRSTCFN